MSPAENWIVNDDFLPEGIVSGVEHVKKCLCYLYSCQETLIVARYKMSQFYIMKKTPSDHSETAVIDPFSSFYHLLHQHEGCLH